MRVPGREAPSGMRRCVGVMRHRDRRTVTAVVKHEAEAVAISRRIARGGIVHAGRQELGTIFEVKGEIHALHRRRYAALLEQRDEQEICRRFIAPFNRADAADQLSLGECLQGGPPSMGEEMEGSSA